MANIPNKPTVALQEWIDEQTPLDHNNLTGGINGNLSALKAAVDGLIDALGGAGSEPPEGIFFIAGELIPESPDDPVTIHLTDAEQEKIVDDRINQILAYDDMKNRVYFFNKETHSIDDNDAYFVCGDYYAYAEGDVLVFRKKTQQSTGTKLYKHRVSFTGSSVILEYITTSSTPKTAQDFDDPDPNFISGKYYPFGTRMFLPLVYSGDLTEECSGWAVIETVFEQNTVKYYDLLTLVSMMDFSADQVTPL